MSEFHRSQEILRTLSRLQDRFQHISTDPGHGLFMNFLKVAVHVKTLNCSKFTTSLLGPLSAALSLPHFNISRCSHRLRGCLRYCAFAPPPFEALVRRREESAAGFCFICMLVLVWVEMKEPTKSSTFLVVIVVWIRGTRFFLTTI